MRAEALHHLQHVGGQEDGEPPPAHQAREERGERLLGDRVHALEGLVEEEELRAVDERGGEPELLLHAEAVVGDQLAPVLGELHGREQLVGAAGGLAAGESEEPRHEDQVLAPGQPVEEQHAVRHHPEAALDPGRIA